MFSPDNGIQACTARVLFALEAALGPFVDRHMAEVYGERWPEEARQCVGRSHADQEGWDTGALLIIMEKNWQVVFQKSLGHEGRNIVRELRIFHKQLAHQNTVPGDAFRLLDTAAHLLDVVGASRQAETIRQDAMSVIRKHLDYDDAAPPIHHGAAGKDDGRDEAPISQHVEKGWGMRQKSDRSPLELRTKILDEIERAVHPYAARRLLPVAGITVHVLTRTDRDQARYEAAFHDVDPSFGNAVRNRLLEAGFQLAPGMTARGRVYSREPKRLKQAFDKYGPIYIELRQKLQHVTAEVTVLKGKAEQASYRIGANTPFLIGRLHEVLDENNMHVIRHNHLAFIDHHTLNDRDREVNKTVSRRHARIEYDRASGAFLWKNEEGRTFLRRLASPEPVRVHGEPVRLQGGDLIYMGKACIRFET